MRAAAATASASSRPVRSHRSRPRCRSMLDARQRPAATVCGTQAERSRNGHADEGTCRGTTARRRSPPRFARGSRLPQRRPRARLRAEPGSTSGISAARRIPALTFTNVYLGAWDAAERATLDQALAAAMGDPHLNNVLAQYFPKRDGELDVRGLAHSHPRRSARARTATRSRRSSRSSTQDGTLAGSTSARVPCACCSRRAPCSWTAT